MSRDPDDRIATVEVASRILAQGRLVQSDANGPLATVALGGTSVASGTLVPSVRGKPEQSAKI